MLYNFYDFTLIYFFLLKVEHVDEQVGCSTVSGVSF